VTGHSRETDPGDEVGALLRVLDGQRRHVLGILDGLGATALRRPVLPSGWHCLGLVQHLTLDVERFWFRAVVAGDEEVIEGLTSGDEAWRVAPDVPARDVLDRYRPGGPTTCSANRTCTPCATFSCTSSPRPPATPATWTRHAN
jgi:hypothetical protein